MGDPPGGVHMKSWTTHAVIRNMNVTIQNPNTRR